MSTTAALATPSLGGSIVAVERCSGNEASCLDPNTDHDFASFTVSYPPDAASGRADLEATFGGRLLWISDAHCGLFTFDTETLKWYGHAFTDVTDLMTGAQSPN